MIRVTCSGGLTRLKPRVHRLRPAPHQGFAEKVTMLLCLPLI